MIVENNFDSSKYIFLFDLDGTLVNTDPIYIKVWNILLNEYGINIDKIFFNNFIKGKNDFDFLKYLIPIISNEKIKKISDEKDKLFIDELKNYKDDILISGAYNFIEKHKINKMCIVTNSNKNASNYILHKTGLDKYISLIISSDDCIKTKPDPYPYNLAIEKLNVEKDKCIIFEDSHSGYKSALEANVLKICLIINEDSCEDIINSNEYKINNYNELNLINLLNQNKCNITYNYIDIIKKSLENIPYKDIINNNDRLKSGYICDINSFKIIYKNNDFDNIIIKISNSNNSLSNVATKLNLYENEIIFYTNISHHIHINIPKFYTSIYIDDNKNGIILENMHKYNGTFNINLNNNINILYNVINEISKLHNRFFFYNNLELIPCMKNLKKIDEILFFQTLIKKKYSNFILKNNFFLSMDEIKIFDKIYEYFNSIIKKAGTYPLNFCHGDLKSPNIFYKDYFIPYFLDWQYIHLNKGISDIVFLIIESLDFDVLKIDIILKYYFSLIKNMYVNFEELMNDFKISLCIFPFFVCIWFNTENIDNLLDKSFPLKFMKKLVKFYNYYLNIDFFNQFISLDINS